MANQARRVYRRDLRWSRLGIPLAGRSRILSRVYRNTVEIAGYAVARVEGTRSVEEPMIREALWQEIHRLVTAERWSRAAIARTLDRDAFQVRQVETRRRTGSSPRPSTPPQRCPRPSLPTG